MRYICQFKGCRNQVERGQKFCPAHAKEEINRLKQVLEEKKDPKKK